MSTMIVPRLKSAFDLTPFNIRQAGTGGGSGFKGSLDRLQNNSRMVHLYIYPKSHRMNATCECFNRTVPESIREQFVGFHGGLLFTDLTLFNEKPADWQVKHNSGIQPQKALGLQTPVQYIINNNQKCSL